MEVDEDGLNKVTNEPSRKKKPLNTSLSVPILGQWPSQPDLQGDMEEGGVDDNMGFC